MILITCTYVGSRESLWSTLIKYIYHNFVKPFQGLSWKKRYHDYVLFDMRSSPHLSYLVDEENSCCPHLPSYPYIAPSYDSHHVWATKDVELNPQVSKRSNLGLFMYPCLYIEEQLYALLVFGGAGTIDVVTII